MVVALQNSRISCPSGGVSGIIRAITKRARIRSFLLSRLRNVIRITVGINSQCVQNLGTNLLRVKRGSPEHDRLEATVNQVTIQLAPLHLIGDAEELQHSA